MIAIDFHTHILPGIDDGSRDIDQTLKMLEEEARQGITHVVATPHFYARYNDPDKFLRERAKAQMVLEAAIADRPDLPQVIMGAEVHYFSGMGESEQLQRLTIGDTKLVLVEMPGTPWTEAAYRDLEQIYVLQGLTPVIAHLDRYIGPWCTHGIPRRLEQLPVLVQANSEFFLNKRTAGMAMRMLRRGEIHFLGSDCHNLDDRAPNLGEARKLIAKKLGDPALAEIQRFEEVVCPAGQKG